MSRVVPNKQHESEREIRFAFPGTPVDVFFLKSTLSSVLRRTLSLPPKRVNSLESTVLNRRDESLGTNPDDDDDDNGV